MELTFYTDYSLRTLMYLALERERLCTISEIAETYGISRNHLVKVVHGLARGGFVTSYRGKGGGITLARDPERIGVGELVRYTEGPPRLAECFRGRRNSCVITPSCGLKNVLAEAANSFLKVLDGYTLADLVDRRTQLRRLLARAATARAAAH
jgi:Rrf2 family transcriptional regulator, nitric oxide-sensitive transcriptional repressor